MNDAVNSAGISSGLPSSTSASRTGRITNVAASRHANVAAPHITTRALARCIHTLTTSDLHDIPAIACDSVGHVCDRSKRELGYTAGGV